MKTVKMAKTVEAAVEMGLQELGLSRDEVVVRVLEEPKSGLFGLIGSKEAVVEIESKSAGEAEHKDIISEIEEMKSSADAFSSESRSESVDEDIDRAPILTETDSVFDAQEESDQKEPIGEELSEENLEMIRQQANNFLAKMLYEMGIPSSINCDINAQFFKFTIIPEDPQNAGIIIGKRGETLDAMQYLVNLVTNKYSDHYIRVLLDTNNYRQKRESSLKQLASKMAYKVRKYHRTMRLEPMNPYERRIIHSALQKEEKIHTYSEGTDPHRRVVIAYREDEEQ